MITHGAVILSLSGLLMTGADRNTFGKLPVSLERPSATSAASRGLMTARSEARQKELRRLEEMVTTLGGSRELACYFRDAGGYFEIDPFFLAALGFVESTYRPRASSRRGAAGIMQLRPLVREVLGVTDPWNPRENIMAGAAYLRTCFDRYARHPESTFLALAAYNIGPGPEEKLKRSAPADRFVKKVLSVYNRHAGDPVRVMDRGARQTRASR
jgi:hypothetical protein